MGGIVSIYEEFMLIVSVVGLVIIILNYKEKQKNNPHRRKLVIIF